MQLPQIFCTPGTPRLKFCTRRRGWPREFRAKRNWKQNDNGFVWGPTLTSLKDHKRNFRWKYPLLVRNRHNCNKFCLCPHRTYNLHTLDHWWKVEVGTFNPMDSGQYLFDRNYYRYCNANQLEPWVCQLRDAWLGCRTLFLRALRQSGINVKNKLNKRLCVTFKFELSDFNNYFIC